MSPTAQFRIVGTDDTPCVSPYEPIRDQGSCLDAVVFLQQGRASTDLLVPNITSTYSSTAACSGCFVISSNLTVYFCAYNTNVGYSGAEGVPTNAICQLSVSPSPPPPFVSPP